MSAVRTLLVTFGNAVAVTVFVLAGAVFWPQALLMMVGAIAGGYFGARMALRLRPQTVGYLVIAIGCSMTAYFFWKTYL